MLTLAKLFGKSPFSPLQLHMDKVKACIHLLPELMETMHDSDETKTQKIAEKISSLEHEADLTKNDIRNHLPKGMFLPIERYTLLEILSLQDDLADAAEDIGDLAKIKRLEHFSHFHADLQEFLKKNLQTFDSSYQIIKEFDVLLEASFGGKEAEKVQSMIEKVALEEHECDILEIELKKKLYNFSHPMNAPAFYQWISMVKEIGSIADLSQRLANRIRMILEVK
jgi:predicted phosphate transport protein (TIGR00153 family)